MKKILTKYMSLFIALAMLFSLFTITTFAGQCPSHGSSFLSKRCGELANIATSDCPWQGENGGGYFHPVTCQIVKYYNFTIEYCTYCSQYSSAIGTHTCHAEHPAAGIYDLILCPY